MPNIMNLPKLGVNMEKAVVVEWLVETTEWVEVDQPLLEAETEKAIMEIPSTVQGFLARRLVEKGQTIKVGEPLAVFTEEGESLDEDFAVETGQKASNSEDSETETFVSQQHDFSSPEKEPESQSQIVSAKTQTDQSEQKRVVLSPLARKTAKDLGIDIHLLRPAKSGARIVEADVLATADQIKKESHTANAALASVNDRGVQKVIPLEGVRGVIADRLSASARDNVRTMLFNSIDMSSMIAWRSDLKKKGFKVSFNTFFVYIVAKALSEFPEMNATLRDREIHLLSEINIGVAVDTAKGLLVPVIRNVDQTGILDLEENIKQKTQRVKDGTASIDELSGGTFTITNLGMFGVEAFIPVINPPECGILALGSIKKTPVVSESDQIVIRSLVQICLAWDHRIIDGAPAARFLYRVKDLAENPLGLIN